MKTQKIDRRGFMAATLGGGAMLATSPAALAAAAPRLEATAERAGPDALRLSWTGAAAASVFASSDPDAKRAAMRPAKVAVAGGSADVEAPVSPRPYFLVAAADGRATRVAERLLPLQGGRNFRDLGGWYAADGRQVKWGKLYRSGVTSGLTDGDLDYLGKLGVSVICDLRNPQERAAEPSAFLKVAGAKVAAFDYDMNASMSMLAGLKTRDQAVDAFAAAYVAFLDTLQPHFTDMFARLAASEAPLAFNCSAGKDRTGTAAALILSILGVPRETVLADYALTQVYTPPSMYKAQMAKAGAGATGGMTVEQMKAFAAMPPEVLDVIMGSDPEVMRRALAQIDARFGGPTALAKARFGLTDSGVAKLKATYLV